MIKLWGKTHFRILLYLFVAIIAGFILYFNKDRLENHAATSDDLFSQTVCYNCPICPLTYEPLRYFTQDVSRSLVIPLVERKNFDQIKIEQELKSSLSSCDVGGLDSIKKEECRKKVEQAVRLATGFYSQEYYNKLSVWFNDVTNDKFTNKLPYSLGTNGGEQTVIPEKSSSFSLMGSIPKREARLIYRYKISSVYKQSLIKTTATINACEINSKKIITSSGVSWKIDATVNAGPNEYKVSLQDGKDLSASFNKYMSF